MSRRLVGITTDVIERDGLARAQVALAYADAVTRAGGEPVLLPPIEEHVPRQVRLCDAFVLTGGGDPRTEPFGEPTHPAATPLHPRRQPYEVGLLRAIDAHAPHKPVLGICLGMQLMALVAGGRLHQHLPEILEGDTHWETTHPIEPASDVPALAAGQVRSRHRQAVAEPGILRVCARAADGLIEAIDDPRRPFYLGVQWHPERTPDQALGPALFDALLAAVRP